jgi:hypothetical protein
MRPFPTARPALTWVPILLMLYAAPAAAAAFEPDEREICPASARVYDPEFEFSSQQMAYYDGRGALRVAPVAPDGSIDSPACAGTAVVPRGVTISLPGLPYRAGPEWALSARGLELILTKLDNDGRPYLARAWYDRRWREEALDQSTDRGLALTSNEAADREPRIVYAWTPTAGTLQLAWREAGHPQTEGLVPGTVDPQTGGSPRWVPGQRALTLALPDAQDLPQAVQFRVDDGQVAFLTTDAGRKDEVWLWPAPEFGGQLALLTVVDGCCIRIYAPTAGGYVRYREIRASDLSRRSGVFSPELLVHEGRSYIAFALAAQRTGDSEIWVSAVALDGLEPTRISDPQLRNVARSEPEWMVTPEGVFVYVSASAGRDRFALNRLKTPITAPAR